MALFGSEKEQKKTSNKVRPSVVRTNNVAKELQKVAKSYEVKVETLDFNLFDIQTYIRMNNGEKEAEWELIEEDKLYELDEESALLNPNFQMKQMYEVEIFAKNSQEERFSDFKIAIGANATKCKVYLSILANSHIKYINGLDNELVVMIQKRKIRSGILVGIFDEMVHDVVSKVTAHIRVAEAVTYSKNETILIAQSYEPTPTIDDALILHYDKKEEVDEKSKVDYASRGFIQNVAEGELLIEYIKPQKGKPGRNCRGEFMAPKEPQIGNVPTFNVDEKIKLVETETNIRYIANENGYIAFEDNCYTIKTDVGIDEISFKTTGSINTGLDSDVSISVKETDAVKDAIGNGMEVEVTEIDVDGNVGSNAVIKAIRANVGGQTHKTATIRAEKIDINVHKGNAYGKNIHITRLEHGTVDGDIVSISQAMGGEIRAKEIEIEVCASYVHATASKFIHINKLQGSENIFTINPILKKDAKKELGENEEHILQLQREIKEMASEKTSRLQQVKDGTASFLDIKKRLMNYKKNGIKMPASFVKQYQQFQKLQENVKQLSVDLEVKKEKLELLNTKTTSFQEDIFEARIINKDRWIGFNEIRFHLVDPPLELSFKPQEGSRDKVFGLVEIEEGEFAIQALNE